EQRRSSNAAERLLDVEPDERGCAADIARDARAPDHRTDLVERARIRGLERIREPALHRGLDDGFDALRLHGRDELVPELREFRHHARAAAARGEPPHAFGTPDRRGLRDRAAEAQTHEMARAAAE